MKINESCGGVEVRHAEVGNMPGSVPGEDVCSSATEFARVTVQGAAIQPCAGVTPGPQDTTDLAARFFDRVAWFNFFLHTMIPFRFSPAECKRRDQLLLQYQWALNTKVKA